MKANNFKIGVQRSLVHAARTNKIQTWGLNKVKGRYPQWIKKIYNKVKLKCENIKCHGEVKTNTHLERLSTAIFKGRRTEFINRAEDQDEYLPSLLKEK